MALSDEELGNINDAASAGSIAATTNLAVQQTNAGDVGQRIAWGSMIQDEAMSDESAQANKLLAVTPFAFSETSADKSTPGTVTIASTSDMSDDTSHKAIAPSNAEALFQEKIRSSGNVNSRDIDPSTRGTVTMGTFLTGTIGATSHWAGSFTYQSDANEEYRSIYINNVKQPSFKQYFTAWYTRSDDGSTPRESSFMMCGSIEAVGTATNGLGQVLLEIRNTDNRTFDTAITREMFFNFRYFI